jgi:hypothetical protein
MAEEFAAAIYHEPDTDDVAVDDAAQSSVDLDDPSLLQQELDADPTADAYASPPPVPKGWYRVKLKSLEVKKKSGEKAPYAVYEEMDYSTPGSPKPVINPKTGKPQAYVSTALEARIQDPGGSYDNVPVFDRFVDSRINRRTKAMKILTVLSALRQKAPTPYQAKTLIETLLKALASEPECDVEIDWEGQPSQSANEAIKAAKEKAPRLKGMHNFPLVDGKRLATTMQNVANIGPVEVRAQAVIIGYAPAGTKSKKK